MLALAAMAAALLAGAPFAVVLALAMVDAVVMMLYRPAQARLLPALVRTPSELTAAAARLSNIKGISQIPGALAGGLLIDLAGAAVTFLITAIAIAVAGCAVIPAIRRAHAAGVQSGPAKARERDGGRLDAGVARVISVSGIRSFVRGLWFLVPFALLAAEFRGCAGSTGSPQSGSSASSTSGAFLCSARSRSTRSNRPTWVNLPLWAITRPERCFRSSGASGRRSRNLTTPRPRPDRT